MRSVLSFILGGIVVYLAMTISERREAERVAAVRKIAVSTVPTPTPTPAPTVVPVETPRRITEDDLKRAEELYVSIARVMKGGVVVKPFDEAPIASRSGRTGLGGPVGTEYLPGRKAIFVEGYPNGVEGATPTVLAFRAGVHTFTDVDHVSRSLERWVFVKVVREK